MIDCRRLSDRIPPVALGRADWTAEEVEHLGECRTCQHEWELVRSASSLGQDLEVNPEIAAGAVLQRLGHQREADRLRRRTGIIAGLAAAAAVVAAVWTGGMDRKPDSASQTESLPAGQLVIPLPELESLQPAELDSVLETMDDPNLRIVNMEEADLTDLDSEELERVLDSWEG